MQADKWGNSGEGDNGQTSRNANVLGYSESAANLLVDNGSNFAIFSECALISKEKLSDFDSAIPLHRFDIVTPQVPDDSARPRPPGSYPSVRPQNVGRCRDRNLRLRVRRNP